MNKIVRFKEFSTNEEWGGFPSATKGEGGGIGSKTANKVFRKIGKFFGDCHDIMNDYLIDKVDSGEITQSESDQIFTRLEFECEGKKKPEIYSMVEQEIEKIKSKK